MLHLFFIFSVLYSHYVTDLTEKLELCLMVVSILLKACVSYFLSNFYFLPNNSPSKTMKNVFYFI